MCLENVITDSLYHNWVIKLITYCPISVGVHLFPVTIFSVYCHLAGATGAWWQRQRDWGRASSLRPSGSLTQTLFHKLSQDSLLSVKKKITKTFIFSSSILHITTRCTSLSSLLFILIFIKSHIMFLHIHLFCTSYCFTVLHFSLFYCTFYFLFLFLPIYIYIYIYTLVWCYFYII